MKLIYGYQNDGKFLILKIRDDGLSEDVNEAKQTVDSVQYEGESYVELDRATCQKLVKHMQFGKKGEMRVADI